MLSTNLPQHALVGESSEAFACFGFTRNFGPDTSASEVLRALMFFRYKPDRPFTTINTISGAAVQSIYADNLTDRAKTTAVVGPNTTDTLDVIRAVDCDGYMRLFEEEWPKCSKGYLRMNAVEKFIESNSSTLRALVYHKKESNHTVVLVNKANTGVYHLLVSLFPALMPWLFEDAPLTEEEKALLSALTKTNGTDEYVAALDKIYERMDFRAQRIRGRLKGFENSAIISERNNLEASVKSFDNDIRYYEDTISGIWRKREETMDRLSVIVQKLAESSKADEDNELMEFFIANRRLNLLGVTGQRIDFEVETDLGNYDPDLYEALRRNKRSYIYDADMYCSVPVEDALRLTDAIFDKQTLRIYLRSRFQLNFETAGYSNVQNHFSNECIRRTVPNPHLAHFTCLGNNERNLRKALKDRDYVGAVAQIITVTSNLNLGESVNVKHFLYDAFRERNRSACIELPDKSRVTIMQAIEWLKASKDAVATAQQESKSE